MCGLLMTEGAGGALCAVVGGFPAGVAQEMTYLCKLFGSHCLHDALQLWICGIARVCLPDDEPGPGILDGATLPCSLHSSWNHSTTKLRMTATRPQLDRPAARQSESAPRRSGVPDGA